MPVYRTPKRGLQYSQAIAEAYASAPEDLVIIDTLEFTHPSFKDPVTGALVALRVVNDHKIFTGTLESTAPFDAGQTVVFQPVKFQFTRPSENEGGTTPEIEITVSNVSTILIPYLDEAKETRIPAGYVLVQHAHKHDHLSILASGTVEVIVDDSRKIIEGPACLTIQAHKHHGVKAMTDVVWFCVHATECIDESKVDQVLISSVNAPEVARIVHCLGV